MDKLQTLLAVCGGISVIGGAAIMVYRFITPALRLDVYKRQVYRLPEPCSTYNSVNLRCMRLSLIHI